MREVAVRFPVKNVRNVVKIQKFVCGVGMQNKSYGVSKSRLLNFCGNYYFKQILSMIHTN